MVEALILRSATYTSKKKNSLTCMQ